MKKIDLLGNTFGQLKVIKYSHFSNKNTYWVCQCSCGNQTITTSYRLRTGKTKSCGCLISKSATKHGLSHTRLYNIWLHMIDRCRNPKSKDYPLYGGRGITVCSDWKSLNNFYKWSMDNGYKDDLQIDRINNNKGYKPENCRWDTCKQQSNNRRTNRFETVNNKSDTLANLCRLYGINYQTVNTRLRRGWSLEKSLKTPIKTNFERMVVNL